MIASLPMYDRPETAAAHDQLWQGIRDALRADGIAAPEALSRDIDCWQGWQHPDLLLGQTCGLPLRARLHDRVTLVGTADYGMPDTPPGYYRSVFVVRTQDAALPLGDFATRRLAYNEPLSHSGWAAPQLAAQTLGFQFDSTLHSGSHQQSAAAVAQGRADIAAVDAITWRALERYDAAAQNLTVIGQTDAFPGLPFITARGRDSAPVLRAIGAGIAALPGDACAILGLRGVVFIPLADYLAVPTPPAPQSSPKQTP